MDTVNTNKASLTNVDVEKQRLSDTFLTFLPKNTSGFTYQKQLIDVQIPRSEHVINLAKSMIYANIQIPLKINKTFVPPATGERFFVGLMNSATVFDELQIHSHNKAIYTDTQSQVNSRIWQMSKPSKYLDANYHSFLNIKNLTKNNGFLVYEITDSLKTTFDQYKFNLKIPLPCLFNCFDNVEAFSTTQLNDNVTLMMQLSPLEKYLCLFETDENGKLIKVKPFSTKNTVILYDDFEVSCSSNESDKYQINSGFKIIVPGHYPTEEEKIEINNVVANGGWYRPYVNFKIQREDISFGPDNFGNTIQSAQNFSFDVHNIYNVILLTSHEHSFSVFDKPKISDIELNASELWKLANNGTHVDATYEKDNDMYLDLLNGFGTQTFKNLERFDDSITHDYLTKYNYDEFYAEITFRLTIDLADDDSNFVDVTDTSGDHYAPGTFEILHTNILNNLYIKYFDPKILEVSEIDTSDSTKHRKSIIARVYIKNNPDSTNKFINNTYKFICDNSKSSDTFKFSYDSVTSIEGNSNNSSGEDLKCYPPTTGADKDKQRELNITIGFEYIKDKDVLLNYNSDKLFGSYLQFYKFAPSNQLGYSADYFSSLINFKFKNEYKYLDVQLGKDKCRFNLTQNNYDNSSIFCCCQTLSFLIFRDGGIDIANPYSADIDVKFQMNNMHSFSGNGHGLGGFIPGLLSPVTSLIGRGINGLRNIIKENRSQANSTYAYSALGKDGYEKHKDIINSNSTMKKGKFKKFINGLKQMENSVNSHGLSHGNNNEEEIAEFATFDDLNLKPFVQSYPAELADYEYKNQLTLDYKNRFNLEKLRLSSFGSEAAMDANNYHGRVGDWFRRIGNKFRGWFKNDGKRIIKNIGSDLKNVASEYASKIATGEISLSDIKNLKPELKSQILNIIRNSDRGTSIEGVTGDAIRYYDKYKKGELKWNEIPENLISRIKEMDMKERSGVNHGIIVRHGFSAGARIKPNILYSVQKQRFNKLKSMNPMELNRKNLRKLYRFNYLKTNGVVDTSHGRLAEILRNTYPNISTRIGYDVNRMVPLRDPTINKIRQKWINDKKDLLNSEHGIKYLGELRSKAKKFYLYGDGKYKYYHKKYKKYKSKNEASKSTPDYKSMKAAWKKYKSQHKN